MVLLPWMQYRLPKPTKNLAECGGRVMTIIDDNYLMGPPQKIFTTNKAFAVDLEEADLQLQLIYLGGI